MATKKMDGKLIAYKQKYEVADICALWKIKKKDFIKLVKDVPTNHSRIVAENLLKKAGYIKHPKPKPKKVVVKLSSKFFKITPIAKL